MNSILQQINGTSVTGIIYGLISITDLVKNGDPVLEEADAIFEALVPKLKHNNYKIRGMAFALMEYLILKSFNKLLNPVAALPNLIFGISSVNKQIQQSAKVCVKFLLVQSPIGSWWKDVENTLKKTKSKETIYELLLILSQLDAEIPLTVIIPMIDSPDPIIRKYSEKIITKSDINRVMFAISKNKVSYQTFRKIENLVDTQDFRSLLYQEESMMRLQRSARNTRQQSEEFFVDNQKPERIIKEPQLITENDNQIDPRYEEEVANDIEEDDSPLKFEKKVSRFIQPDDNEYIIQSDSIEDNSINDSSEVESLHSMRNRKRTNFTQNRDAYDKQSIRSQQSRRKGGEDDKESATSSRRKRINDDDNESEISRRRRKINDDDSESEVSRRRRGINDDDSENATSSRRKRRINDDDGESEISRSSKSQQSTSSQAPEPFTIGRIHLKPRKNLPFALRDLSGKTWLERLTFFEILDDALDSGRCTNLNGEDIMKCIISGIFPTHKKLTTISISVLTKTITYYPESINHNYLPVVTYILAIFKQSSKEEKFDELITALSQEGDVSEVVDAAISAESDLNRPVNSIAFILTLFDTIPNITLNQKAFCNLLGFILKDEFLSSNAQILLKIACANQTEFAFKYYHTQTPRTQAVLRRFIPKSKLQELKQQQQMQQQQARKQQRKDQYDESLIQQMSKSDLLYIIKQESRKGNQASISKMVSAYKQYTADDINELESIFFIFIKFLATIDDDKYEQNLQALFDIAFAQFSSSRIISSVNSPKFTLSLIHGLSRFVWNCPSTSLSKGKNIYQKLYELFCQSDGNTRLEIVQIIIALEKVTNVSFDSLDGIKPLHLKVLNKLRQQFVIE